QLAQLTGNNEFAENFAANFAGEVNFYQKVGEGKEGHLMLVASSLAGEGGDVELGRVVESDSPLYRQVVEEKKSYQGMARVGESMYFSTYTPYTTMGDGSGEVSFVIASGVALDNLLQHVVSTRFGKESYGFVFNAEGGLLAHPELTAGTSLEEMSPTFWEGFAASSLCRNGGGDVCRFDYSYHGTEKRAFVGTVEGMDWFFAFALPHSEMFAPLTAMRNKMALWVVPALIVGVVLLLYLVGRLVNPLKDVVNIAEQIAAGDLTVELWENDGSRNEVNQAMGAFATILQSYRKLVNRVKELNQLLTERGNDLEQIDTQVSQESSSARESAENMRSVMESISSAAEETNAGVEEVSSGAQNSAKIASELSENASTIRKDVEDGNNSVQDVAKGVSEVGSSSKQVVEAIHSLEDSVSKISSFVETITGIADQTNLLALNAAIEAARAGEAGRGFAVVAEEVRKLAEESNKAAGEVGEVIGEIQSKTRSAADDVSRTESLIEKADKDSGVTSQRIANIMKSIEEMSNGIENIAASAQEQSASSEEIASAMDSIVQQVTEGQTSSQDVEKVSREVEEMTRKLTEIRHEQEDVVKELQQLVAAYRLKKGEDDDARLALVEDQTQG
ncbi:MAG: Cache 3/Cache 2 fusion domain-containing protein, partial [Synergistales bacterium]|nr:Cache 3/Cache 2 fusion domain-containing protein [Synergistales bacterium]